MWMPPVAIISSEFSLFPLSWQENITRSELALCICYYKKPVWVFTTNDFTAQTEFLEPRCGFHGE